MRNDTVAEAIQINHTSLRCRPLGETLAYARSFAATLGITRVTDVTRLDRIGLPVYSSIRPGALDGSLCVNSGKGILPQEAEAGAYMEAIEFAMAEPNRAGLDIYRATPYDILDGHQRREAILDFCPMMDTRISLDESITGVAAKDLLSGNFFLVPAELAFMPYPAPHVRYFGSHTNGLSSGNSRCEAQIHGVLEVIERDIMSFQTVSAQYLRLDPASYPASLLPIAERIASAGLELVVRYGPNLFGIPFFAATVIDHQTEDPLYINGGFGCHTLPEIALNRAVAEALQSRLTFIHGGRDDLIQDYLRFSGLSFRQRRDTFARAVRRVKTSSGSIHFAAIPYPDWSFQGLEQYLDHLLDLLQPRGMDHILSVDFLPSDLPLQVVKIIIPKMEFFTRENPRLGPRLRAYASKVAHNSFWRA
jgi:ribosomal protein S12 methylthiotransferase accessory factor